MTTIELYEVAGATIGIIATIPIYKGWATNLLSWNRKRKIDQLRKDVDLLTRLHSSDREFFGWFLQIILIILAVFCIIFMTSSVRTDQNGVKLVSFFHWLFGGIAYFVSIYGLGIYHRLKKIDDHIEILNKKIERLENRNK